MIRFNDAWRSAQKWVAANQQNLSARAILVRDVVGRIRLLVDAEGREPAAFEAELMQRLGAAAGELAAELGAHGGAQPLLASSRLLLPDELFTHGRLLQLEGTTRAWTLDLQLTGLAFTSPEPKMLQSASIPRAVLYGLKGGVGRTTAAALLARHLARDGRRVVVFDLDLEAPGVGFALLNEANWPSCGVVDWLVEDAVGQGDDIVRLMAGRVEMLDTGEIWVVPTNGRDEDSYLHKLGRALADVPSLAAPGQQEAFPQRLQRMVAAVEKVYRPDAVLIDARAGLHDLSAAALVALRAHNFLFALDTPQTWSGYGHLLRHWQREHPGWRTLRERLQMVMGQVPELNRQLYIDRFHDHAYDLLSAHCYDHVGPTELPDFHPGREDEEAPHIGWQIGWSSVFQTYDPVGSPATEQQIEQTFGDFLRRATTRLFETDGDADG